MSSKLWILAALLVIPFSAHAQLDKANPTVDELKVLQNCPTTNTDVCAIYQRQLTKHIGHADYDRVKLEMTEQILSAQAFQGGGRAEYEKALLADGIDKATAHKVAKLRYGREQKPKNADELFLLSEGISGTYQNESIKTRMRHLQIYAYSDLDGVGEVEKHQMLQRAQRLGRILEERTRAAFIISNKNLSGAAGRAQ